MFDNIYTKYEDTKMFISECNANDVINVIKDAEKNGHLTAELCAYMSKAYVFAYNNEMALHYALRSVELNPTYSYGYVRTAFAYARLGEPENSLKYTRLAEITNSDDNIFVLSFLAVLYNYCGQQEKVEEIIKMIKANYENTALYNYCLGFIYSQDEPEEAINFFKKAESLGYGDKFNLWTSLADNYSLLDDFDKAEEYSDKCLQLGEGSVSLRIKAECLKEKGEYSAAVPYLRKKYKISHSIENKLKTLTLLIYCIMYSEYADKTERYIKFAFKNFPKDYHLYYVAASYYESEEQYDKAINIYTEMLNLSDNAGDTYASISYCYSQQGLYDRALHFANKSIEKNPENAYGHYRKGRVLAAMKVFDEAIKSFESSIEYNRSDIDSFQWISYCYSMLNNYEKSLEYANRAILLDKTDCYSYFRKAWAYQELGRYKEALTYYDECIRCDNRYIDAYINASYVYSKIGDSKQSLIYANKALLLNKDYSYAHYRKAWALQESGRYEEAFDGYSKAIELDPTDIYNYLGIACISLNNQENENALLYANKALFIDRNCGGAYYYKSLALSNLGKIKEAEVAYSKALQLGYLPE